MRTILLITGERAIAFTGLISAGNNVNKMAPRGLQTLQN